MNATMQLYNFNRIDPHGNDAANSINIDSWWMSGVFFSILGISEDASGVYQSGVAISSMYSCWMSFEHICERTRVVPIESLIEIRIIRRRKCCDRQGRQGPWRCETAHSRRRSGKKHPIKSSGYPFVSWIKCWGFASTPRSVSGDTRPTLSGTLLLSLTLVAPELQLASTVEHAEWGS